MDNDRESGNEESVEWLVKNYEYWKDEQSHGDAIFHWGWERHGNFRTYRVVEFDGTDLEFYARAERFFSFYKQKIVIKREADKLKEADKAKLAEMYNH